MKFHCSDNSKDFDDSTTLKVHFKDLTCIKYRRDMYMTWDGLFGKFGFWFSFLPNWLCHGRKETEKLATKVRQFIFELSILWNSSLCSIFVSLYTLAWTMDYGIASFGGIFGLCLGGSVISLVELLYFYTLRLYSIIIHRGTCTVKSDTKHVSINSNVKTVVIDPKSFLQNFKAYQQQSKYHRKRFCAMNASHGILLGGTADYDINKPIIHTFLD